MRKVVLAFTNYFRWNQLKDQFNVEEVGWNDRYEKISENKLYKCAVGTDNRAVLEPVEDFSSITEGIYLVYDEIVEDDFKKIMEQYRDYFVCALVHSNGMTRQQLAGFCEDVNANCEILEGIHDAASCYYDMFRILTDNDGDKFNRVLDSIFNPVNVLKRDFLNMCFTPGLQNDDDFIKVYNELSSLDEYKAAMKSFKKCYEGNQFEDYKNEFKRLRDVFYPEN